MEEKDLKIIANIPSKVRTVDLQQTIGFSFIVHPMVHGANPVLQENCSTPDIVMLVKEPCFQINALKKLNHIYLLFFFFVTTYIF